MSARDEEAWGEFLSRARAEAQGLTCDGPALRAALAPRLAPDLAQALRALHAGDLLLVEAVLSGQPAAVARFQAVLRRQIHAALARGPHSADAEPDEVAQALFERIVLGAGGQPPALRHYAGTGPLEVWLRVVVERRRIDLLRRQRAEQALGEGLFDALAAQPESELGALRRRHGPDFKRAFARAVEQLTPAERNLLRYQLAGLTAGQVAKLRGAHRVTIAKQLAATRRHLAELTRHALAQALGADDSEAEALLQDLHGALSLSLERLLRERDGEDLSASDSL